MASAFVLAATLTFGFRTLALWTDVIAKPSADRWNTRPVPLLGGGHRSLAIGERVAELVEG